MAGVSTKEIKNRIRSMESTKQITKAMEMVASSKLRKAQTQAIAARPYFEILYATIHEIAQADREFSSAYLTARPVRNRCYVVFAGDRGLAGGYNSNVFRMVTEHMEGVSSQVLPVGKKAVDYFQLHGQVLDAGYNSADAITVGDCFSIAKHLCKLYLDGQFDEIWVGYTQFESVLSQKPECVKLLPLQGVHNPEQKTGADMVYEPDAETVFAAIIPEYLGGVLYGALCESRASEHAARRSAMDSATQNAQEMIADLSLQFNRARQAAITQEITEIVAGSQ